MLKETVSHTQYAAAVQAVQGEQNDLKARIISRASGLNYWGKKMDATRLKVIKELADEFATYAISQSAIQEILAGATPPKRPKSEVKAKVVKMDSRPVSAGVLTHDESTRLELDGRVFIVTSAQNNTPVHTAFLENLKIYADSLEAQLIVFPFIYNLDQFQNGEGSDSIWYDPAIKPYLQRESVWIGSGRKVSAMNFNILPTAANPLGSGMAQAIGAAEAMIVPHATLTHDCVPVLGAQFGRVVPQMYSTGTITQRNYVQQRAGQTASARHNFGALIVEFNKHGQFWVRQIETDENGGFCDLRNYVNGSVCDVDIVAINYGDIHAEKIDSAVAMMQWGAGSRGGVLCTGDRLSMLDYLRPQYQMVHDLLDFAALNHHNREQHFHMASNYYSERKVTDDLSDVSAVLSDMYRQDTKTVVVYSNHDDALFRWMGDAKYEPRKDPANALIYFQLQVAAYSAIADGEQFEALPVALEMTSGMSGAYFLKASESFLVGGVELGEHGHAGVNGARGNKKMYSSYKATTGHTHTSSIHGGHYVAGVSGKLAMGYNETGASNWVHACVIQYATGFRSIIHVKQNGNGGLDYRA